MRSARAGMTTFGVPALAKPLIATVSPGLMNFTASDADITFDANAVARMRLEVALCPVSPKVELTAPG